MIRYVDISKSKQVKLPYLSNSEYFDMSDGKGWSYSNVYHLSEIKDVYLVIKKFDYTSKREFTELCIKKCHLPFKNTPWDEDGRRVLEHVNALKNFGLITTDHKIIDPNLFVESEIGGGVSETDKLTFKKIFFSYFRFKEMMTWFVDPNDPDRNKLLSEVSEFTLKSKSNTIYAFGSNGKFTDSFIFELKDTTPVYNIVKGHDESAGGILRFWDVFIKWAQELDLLEKFNLKNMDYELSNNFRSFSCIYFKSEIPKDFDLLHYLKENYRSKYISIPKLIFKIATDYRYPISCIREMVVNAAKIHPDQMSLQRTSEIFIRNTEINFVPKVDNFFVSHILLQ